MVHGKVSKENLYHYRCGTCDAWFSIGDPQDLPKKLYCPVCGKHQEFVD